MKSKDLKNSNPDFEQVLFLITEARNRVYVKANAELVLLYYNVGKFVADRIEQGVWGDGTVNELATFIQNKAPNLSGFNRRGLYRMKQFYETYNSTSPVFLLWNSINNVNLAEPLANSEIIEKQVNTIVSPPATQFDNTQFGKVSPLATQLQGAEYQHEVFTNSILSKIMWTSHLEILSTTKTAEETIFYLFSTIKEKWNKLELRRQLQSATFERSIMSNQIVSAVQTQLPQGIFKDPYIFEFLNLPDAHSEFDLEKAIILNLQKFILEVGKGFTYMGNQYRLQVGNKDYFTDLLFYHRDLQCLVMFELKIQEFEPEFLGKLNFYLEALDRDVKRPNEKPSIGVLLCKGKDIEVVEYAMARNTSPAVIAEYETKLIDKKLLADKLNQLAEILNKNID